MSGGPRYLFPKRYSDLVQRFRVASGFLLLVVFTWLPEPTGASLMTGLSVAVAGLLLRGWAAGHLAKNEQLAMSGPYAYMRNPLYAGTLLTALGMVIAARSIWLAMLFAAVFLLVYLPAIELEEQHLREIFPGVRGVCATHPAFSARCEMARAGGAIFLEAILAQRGVQSGGRFSGGNRLACDTLSLMRVGCFTALLSQFPLEKVLEKLKKLNISTVELGTGNYPGDPHCKLSMAATIRRS